MLEREIYIVSRTRYSTMGGNACFSHAGTDLITHARSAREQYVFRASQASSKFPVLSRGSSEADVLATVDVLDLVLAHDFGVVVVVERGCFPSALQAVSPLSLCREWLDLKLLHLARA